MIADDTFENVYTPPLRNLGASDEAVRGQRPTIESVEGLQQALRERTGNQDRSEGGAISLVGSDGKLNVVAKRSSWATPSAYPTALRVVSGNLTIYIDATEGIKVLDAASGNYTKISTVGVLTVYNNTNSKSITISPTSLANNITIDNAGVKLTNATSSDYVQLGIDGKLTVYDSSGGKSAVIDPSLVTANMTVREIDVCDAGVAKKMLVLGSAAYT